MGDNGTKSRIAKLISEQKYGLTIEEIANKLAINRMTASKYLAVLEASGKIVVREVGKAKLHYPKNNGFRKWLNGNGIKSSCGLNSVGFFFIALLILAATIFSVTMTAANSELPKVPFTFSLLKNYPEKLIIIEINGPPLTTFTLLLENPEGAVITPQKNVSLQTDENGHYELRIIGFVSGNYSLKLMSDETAYGYAFEVEPLEGFECNRTFLEYRIDNITNITAGQIPGEYVWDICRDFVEANVTEEEVISEMAENRSFLEEELNITEMTESRTFVENETVANETFENRSFVEQAFNMTPENLTSNVTEINASDTRLLIERITDLSPEKDNFGMNEKPRFRLNSKKIFAEKGKTIEEFPKTEDLHLLFYDPNGEVAGINANIVEVDTGSFEIELNKSRAFKPGKYSLILRLQDGNETQEQAAEFLWGVLALNTHKSVYLPGEEAFIGIAVLDNEGHMVCDADVTLEIAGPNDGTALLTTSDGTIKVSPECEIYGVTNLPDYYAYYTVNAAGTYTMKLTAVTRSGERAMTDAFEVRENVDFDVTRRGPTRIYPPAKYSMAFGVNANKDYEGPIREYVPSSFGITPQDDLTVTDAGDTKILEWSSILTSGGNYTIDYEFDAPDISPYLFILGQLEIGEWNESREWMVASDSPGTEIDQCQELSSPNTVYELNQSVNSSGTCFNITADNVTLDGKGYSLAYATTGTGKAIYINGSKGITIKNMKINQTQVDRVNCYAIQIENSYDNNITNVTLDIDGDDSPDGHDYVIYFINTTNSTISGNNITVQGGCDYCHGIYLTSNSDNITIEHNKINMKGVSYYSAPIYSDASKLHTIYNNTITQKSNYYGAIRLYNSDNCTIDQATIDVSPSAWARSIDLEYYSDYNIINNTVINTIYYNTIYINNNARNNNITNTNITGTGGSSYRSIYIQTNSHGTYMDNMIIQCVYECIFVDASNNGQLHNSNITQTSDTSTNAAFRLYGSGWTINNTRITTLGSTNGCGIELRQVCDNTEIINTHIKTYASGTYGYGIDSVCNTGSTVYFIDSTVNAVNDTDIFIREQGATYNFTNTTFLDKGWGNTATGTINVFWYLDAYVNDTGSAPIQNANVTAWDKDSNQAFTALTQSSGWITRQTVLEYSQDNDETNYKTPHTLNVIGTGYYEKNKTVEIDGNRNVYITLTNTSLPNVQLASPENGRIYTNSTVLINITNSSNTDSVWYIWNYTNYTYTQPLYFNFTTEGWHNITAYANNSNGTSSDYIEFRISSGPVNLTDCQKLDSPNVVYLLNKSITSQSGICFDIRADNVTLDGAGYSLSYAASGDGKAIYSGSHENITIMNLKIDQTNTNAGNSPAIQMEDSTYNKITNNTFDIHGFSTTISSMSYAIHLINTTNSTISGNNMTTRADCEYCYGIHLVSGSRNTTIEHNRIYTEGQYSKGIYSHASNVQTIYNNTIDVNNGQAYPIHLYQSNNCVINHTTIDSSGDGRGIFFEYSDNNVITNTDITTSSIYAIDLDQGSENAVITNTNITSTNNRAIYIHTNSNGTYMDNMIIQCVYECIFVDASNNGQLHNSNITQTSDTSTNAAFRLYGSGWTINNTRITTLGSTNGRGIELRQVCDNTEIINTHIKTYGSGTSSEGIYSASTGAIPISFKDSTINSINDHDLAFVSGTATPLNITNTTFVDSSWVSSSARINIYWYLDAYVNDTGSAPIQNANVTAWDKDSNQAFTALTQSSGWITRQTLQEYWQNSTDSYYYSNYTVNVAKSGYIDDYSSVNLTTNRQLYFTLMDIQWANSSFDRCMNITILNAGSENLSNFPAYVNLTYDSDMLPDFMDIRFYSEGCRNGGSLLDYEIENYTSSDRAHVWVRIPSLPSSGTTISVYYKNNTAVSSGENATGVWDSNYVGVWHMTETSGMRYDSTSNSNNLTDINSSTGSSTGMVASAADFESDSESILRINDTDQTGLDLNGSDYTFTFWINPESTTMQGFYEKGATGGGNCYAACWEDWAGGWTIYHNDGGDWGQNSSSWSITTGVWSYWTVSFNVSNGDILFSKDGVFDAAKNMTEGISDNDLPFIFGWNTDRGYLDAMIDEIRISNKVRSAAWINQSYLIVANQSDYVTFGQEQNQNLYIYFIPPTDNDSAVISRNWSYVNVSVTDDSNTSAFIDWNYSLIGWWSMDFYNDSGVFDNSSYGNFGEFQGGLGTSNITTGRYGESLNFDGTDDYLDVGLDSSLNISDVITVAAWVKSTADNYGTIAGKHAGGSYGWRLSRDSDTDSFDWRISTDGTNWNGGVTSSNSFQVGQWYHIVSVYNGSYMSVYINGVEDTGGDFPYALSGSINVAPASTRIGIDAWNFGDPGCWFEGTIDDVRIFNRALSQEEINASYNAGLYRLYHNFTNLTDGTYAFKAYAIDAAGNVNSTEERTITVESTSISSCQELLIANVTYHLTQNVSSDGTCFTIKADNITLDCQGYSINASQTETGYGVNNTEGYDNITIRNCYFRPEDHYYSDSIRFNNSLNPVIINNTFMHVSSYGYTIRLENGCHNANISNNNLTQLDVVSAIYIYESDNATIQDNNISNPGVWWSSAVGSKVITLRESKNASLYNNNITSGYWQAVYVVGIQTAHFNHTIGEDNTVNGMPIKYIAMTANTVYDSLDWSNYEVLVFNSTNLTFNNLTLDHILFGDQINNSRLENSTITSTAIVGLELNGYGSGNTRVTNSEVKNNIITHTVNTHPVVIYATLNVNFTNNTILNTGTDPTIDQGPYACNFINNTINATNAPGISTYPDISNISFEGNTITTAGATDHYGIYLNYDANLINMKKNTITSSGPAIKSWLHTRPGNVMINDTILNSTGSYDIEIVNNTAGRMNLTNVTLANNNISWPDVTNMTINVFWYLDVNVTNSTGDPLDGVEVNVTDKDGSLHYSGVTEASGLIPTQAIQEYWQNLTDSYYYSNYSVNVSKSGYAKNSTTVNLTTNKIIHLSLSGLIYSCGELDSPNTVYELGQNVSSDGTCFTIKAHNITLDCKGYSINASQTETGYGVNNTEGYDNITIRNCNFYLAYQDYNYVVYLKNSVNSLIFNNNFTHIGDYGYVIRLDNQSNNANISNNYINQNDVWSSIYINESDNVTIQENNMSINGVWWAGPNNNPNDYVRAITLHNSKNATLYNNNITSDHWQSVDVSGTESEHFNHTIGEDNTMNSMPVKYLAMISDTVYQDQDWSSYEVIVFNITNVTFSNLTIDHILFGDRVKNSTLENSTIKSTALVGLELNGFERHNQRLYNFNVRNNIINHTVNSFPIVLHALTNVNITNNTILNTGTEVTIYQIYSTCIYNLYNNTISSDNAPGINLYPGNTPIITFEGNNITTAGSANNYGLYFSWALSRLDLKNNRITSSGPAIRSGMYVSGGQIGNVIINDSILNSTGNYDIIIVDGTNGTMNLTNATLGNNNISWPASTTMRINVHWYLDVNVTNSTGDPIEGVEVNVTDKDGSLVYSGLTGSNGLIPTQAVQEYWQNVTDSYYYSNYTVNAAKSGYIDDYSSVNLTTNRQLYFTLMDIQWANSSFDRCMNITILNAGSENLSNFPAYVNLTYDSDMLPDFMDIRFYSEGCRNGGSLLDYEIENYTSSDRAHVWVRIPSLPAAGTNISVYYKNNTAVSSGENATGVWDSNYMGVWHMQRVNATDSTSNNNDGNESGGVTLNSSGKIDGANEFDGDNDYIVSGNNSVLNPTNEITIEAWVKIEENATGGEWPRIVGKEEQYSIYQEQSSTDVTVNLINSTSEVFCSLTGYESGGLNLNTWYYLVAAYNGTTGDLKNYQNGILNTTCTEITGTINTTSYNLSIGARDLYDDSFFNGTIDEVRISNLSRSASWINMSYLIVANQSDFITFGQEQWQTGNMTIDSCQDLNVPDIIYELNQSVNSTGTCFNILANDITLDCQGYTINYSQTSSGHGVESAYVNFTTIKNCNIIGSTPDISSSEAILFNNTHFGLIDNNTIIPAESESSGWTNHGIIFYSSNNNTIKNNNITVTTYASSGIAFPWAEDLSSYNNITNNTITGTGYGISLCAAQSTVAYNTISTEANAMDEGCGNELLHVINNTQKGKPIIYHYNNDSITIENDHDIGQLILTECDNVTVRNLSFSVDGIIVCAGSNITIENSTIAPSGKYIPGVYLMYETVNNTIRNTNITNNNSNGIIFAGTRNNTVINSSITVTGSSSIYGTGAPSALTFYGDATNNNITGCIINTTNNDSDDIYGIIIYISDWGPVNNTRITDTVITTARGNDIYMDNNWTHYLINVTFDKNISFNPGTNGTINVYWYLDAYVNDTGSAPIQNANVTAWDKDSNQAFTALTQSSGWITRQTLQEYWQNSTDSYYYSNYTVNASRVGYAPNSTQVNMTTNKEIQLTLAALPLNITLNLNPNPCNNSQAVNIYGKLNDSNDEGLPYHPVNIYINETKYYYNPGSGLLEANPSYDQPTTDSTGNYSYNFTAPSTLGNYTVKVNATNVDYTTEASENLTVEEYYINITLNLDPNPANTNQTVYVYGHLNDSNGNNISNNSINIYIDDVPANITSGNWGPNWWNSSWKYRTKIYTESLVSSNLNNTLVMINFSTSNLIAEGKMRSDCGDARFTDSSQNELQYTLETSTCNTSNTVFWVWANLTGNANTTVYSYYGNSNANLKTNYTNPDTSLILLMHFDNSSYYGENSTHVYDFSRYGNNGTVVTDTQWNSSGKYGGSYQFDGTEGYINVSNNAGLGSSVNFTYSAWIWMNDDDTENQIIRHGGSRDWDVQNYVLRMEALALTGSKTVTPNTWHHAVVTYDGSNTKMYLDGELDVSSSDSTETETGNLWIGACGCGQHNWNGTMDEVRVYNRSLSATEILAIYNSTRNNYISNQTLTQTDSNGNYNYTFTAPDTPGNYTVKVNTTYNYQTAEATANLTVYSTNLTSCQDLDTANTTYLLQNNVSSSGTCFNIQANNITLDCQGYTINYSIVSDGFGVNNTGGYDNINIINCIFNNTRFDFDDNGIELVNSYNSNIINNTILSDYGHSIRIENCNSTNIINNTLLPNTYMSAINIQSSNNTLIRNNTMTTNNYRGAWVRYSPKAIEINSSINITMYNNNITSDIWGPLELTGSETAHFNHTIGEDNTDSNEPIKYIGAVENTTYQDEDWSGYYVVVAGVKNVTFTNITIDQIYFGDETNNTRLINSSKTSTGEYEVAIDFYKVRNFELRNSVIEHNYGPPPIAIRDDETTNLTIINNTITNNFGGVAIVQEIAGENLGNEIYIYNNTINTSSSGGAIRLSPGPANTSVVEGNTIIVNGDSDTYGIGIENYVEKIIFKNNIVTSTGPAFRNSMTFDSGSRIVIINDSFLNSTQNFDIKTEADTYGTINLTNVTLADNNISINETSISIINVFWYLDVHVNDTDGNNLENVNITAWDKDSNQAFTALTQSSGWITRQTLQEYWQNASDAYYYSNYTINASKINYITNTTQLNLTTNRQVYLTLMGTGWANSSFDRCMNITISNSGSETLVNFPAYVNLTYDSDMQPDFADIRFYNYGCNQGGSQIDYEIENYTSSNRAHVWVRIPSLPAAGTNISVYYKNNTAVGSEENASGVWDSYYMGVWHMQRVNATDSTQYGNNGNESGGVTLNSSGRIDGANEFDGNDDYIDFGNTASLQLGNTGTVEAWLKYSTQSDNAGVISKSDWANDRNGYTLGIDAGSSTLRGQIANDSDYNRAFTNNGWNDNQWHHVGWTWDGGYLRIYVDGVSDATPEPQILTPNSSVYNLQFGKIASVDYAFYYAGSLDEVRISNINRSASWINQSYQMVANQSDFVAFGQEEGQIYNVTIDSCQDLDLENAVYELNQSVNSTGTCFNITAHNVTLDCQGYKINFSQTTSADGVVSWHANFTTIQNCIIVTDSVNYDLAAVRFIYSNNGTIYNNTISTSNGPLEQKGIYLSDSSDNMIKNNNITTTSSRSDGIYIPYGSDYNTIFNNTITTTGGNQDTEAISLSSAAPGTNIAYNTILSETNAISILYPAFEFNITNNTVDGKPIYYYYNNDSIIIENDDNIGQLIVTYSNNITIRNLTLTTNGILLGYVYDSLIENCTIAPSSGYARGINLDYYLNNINNNNIIRNNNIITINADGIALLGSNNSITNNTITVTGTAANGISSANSFNNITGCIINLTSSSNSNAYGIYFGEANNTRVTDTIIVTAAPNSAYVRDIYVIGDGINNLTNVSFDSNISFEAGYTGKINVFWYLDAYVNDTNGAAIDSATVTAWDIYSTQAFTALTNSTGWITRQTLQEYWQNSTTSYYYTNYTVNASKTGYTTNMTQVNLTTNKQISLTLSRLINITLNLNPNPVLILRNVSIYGHVNDSDGTNIANNTVNIYINNTMYYYNNNTALLENTTAWWNTSFAHRTKINITSYVATNLNNTIALVNLSTSDLITQNKIRSDCGDTRFTDNNGNELQYTLETSTCNTANTIYWVWMNLTGNANNTIYAYYGNSAATTPTSYTNPDNGLVLYMHFDNSSTYGENNTLVYDSSKNNNNGTCTGDNCPNYTNSGKYGQAMLFDGSNDYLNVTDPGTSSLDITGSITISAWVYLKDGVANHAIVMKDGLGPVSNYQFYFYTSVQELQFDFGNYGAWNTHGTSWPGFNEWHHVAVTYNQSYVTFYKDGVAGTPEAEDTAMPANNYSTTIGGRFNGTIYHQFFNGTIDEVRIYNRSLSSDEILAIYNSTKNNYIQNHSLPRTDNDGNYNYTLIAPSNPGNYTVKVNTTYQGMTAEANATLTVQSTNLTSCQNLTVADIIYTLANNVNSSGTCFNILADNITLDCQGYTINYSQTSSGHGVEAHLTNYTTIKNCNIIGSTPYISDSEAIRFNRSNFGTIDNNTIIPTESYSYTNDGIIFYRSNNNTIKNNNITITTSYAAGIAFEYTSGGLSSYNNITNNTITGTGNSWGIGDTCTVDSTFSYNTISTEAYAITGNCDTRLFLNNNTQKGKPIIFHYDNDSITIENDHDIGQLILTRCDNVTVRNMSFSVDGIVITGGSNIIIENSTIAPSGKYIRGVSLIYGTNNNTIRNTNITTNNSFGIYFNNAYNNTVTNSRITLTGSDTAQTYYFSSALIFYSATQNNNVTGCIINTTNNDSDKVYGIGIYSSSVNNTRITDTVITTARGNDIHMDNNWTHYLINVTFDKNISFNTGTNGTINVYWYLDAYVNDTGSAPIQNANVTAWDKDSNQAFSETTNSTGQITRQTLQEYWQNSTTSYYYTNYTVNASLTGSVQSQTVNMSTNRLLVYTFDINPPSIYFVPPTDNNSAVISRNWSYVNVSVSDTSNTSAFIDWNYSLIGWWSMDFYNDTGVFDNSTNNNFVWYYGDVNASRISSGIRGKSILFDGVSDYLAINDTEQSNFNITNAFTIMAWVKLNSLGKWHTVAGKWNSGNYHAYEVQVSGSNVVILAISNDTTSWDYVAGSTPLDSGIWYHIAAIYNGSYYYMYLDGKLDTTPKSWPYGVNTGVQAFRIGAQGYGTGVDEELNGSLDEVQIWNRALSPEEINASYNAGLYRLEHNFTGLADGNYTFRAYAQDSAGNVNSTELREIQVQTCSVDFNMSINLQQGIMFAEQDPGSVNVSAVGNGFYNVTDLSTSGCGTVNVSIMATGDLVNGSSVIGIGNVTVNSTSPDSQTIQLSTNYQLIRSNVPAGANNITTLYFWLSVPAGQEPRIYNTTIYVKEEKE